MRSNITTVPALVFEDLYFILGAKNSTQSARQSRGFSAPRLHCLPYHVNDTGLLDPLSSSLDYGHLLNYFLETNLFFNLRQMAIWPTIISPPLPSYCEDVVRQMWNCFSPADYKDSQSNNFHYSHPFRNPLYPFPVKCGLKTNHNHQ